MRATLHLLLATTLLNALPVRAEDPTPIPELKRWEQNMEKYGEMFKDQRALGIMPEQYVYYYDGEWVYFQIADYTGNPKYLEYGKNCRETYRGHVLELNGKLPGHRVHPHGLYEDYKRNKDEKSKEALLLLAKNSHFAPGRPGNGGAPDSGACRENAYILMTMLLAEDLGEKMPQIENGVKADLTCLDQFAVSKTAPVIQPFMTGLLAEALIQYAEMRKDSARIVPPLTVFADWLWEQCWVPKDSAFCYLREKPNDPSTVQKDGCPDLNLLIAPMYAWLYKKTGEARFRDRGDQAFAGGVKGAWLEKGKAFSQNYRSSFSYVKWRREGPERNAGSAPAAKPAVDSTANGKKESVAIATSAAPPPATIDPAPYRAAVEANLKKNAKVKKGDRILVAMFKRELGIASVAESGLNVLMEENEMPLRWKDLSNDDIVRLAELYCRDAEGLFNAGALATALRQYVIRERFLERLYEADPSRANELQKMR
jgi:hypothetical protein